MLPSYSFMVPRPSLCTGTQTWSHPGAWAQSPQPVSICTPSQGLEVPAGFSEAVSGEQLGPSLRRSTPRFLSPDPPRKPAHPISTQAWRQNNCVARFPAPKLQLIRDLLEMHGVSLHPTAQWVAARTIWNICCEQKRILMSSLHLPDLGRVWRDHKLPPPIPWFLCILIICWLHSEFYQNVCILTCIS